MIWFTSDLHFGHNKSFMYEPRGFKNIVTHDYILLTKYNSVVNPDDDVYILGDLMLNDNEAGLAYIRQMKGKLHIILGNHDTVVRAELYQILPNVVEVCEAKTIKIGKQYYFLCHYPTLTANYDDKPLKQHLINLHGHTHQQMNFLKKDNPFMYHVGVDSHNCFPVSIDQISQDIHQQVQKLYQIKVEEEKRLKDYYENGLGYFETHPLGVEILD